MQYGFRRKSLNLLIVASLLTSVPAHARRKETRELTATMPGDQRIAHALNRLAFGPRSADVDLIKSIGVDRWIEQQLHPKAIPENPVLEMKLQPLETLHMSS